MSMLSLQHLSLYTYVNAYLISFCLMLYVQTPIKELLSHIKC